MEKKESMKKECPVVLPKCKFADSDNVECCEYCDYNIDERTTLLFIHEVLCGLDGKWHSSSHVCRNWK